MKRFILLCLLVVGAGTTFVFSERTAQIIGTDPHGIVKVTQIIGTDPHTMEI